MFVVEWRIASALIWFYMSLQIRSEYLKSLFVTFFL